MRLLVALTILPLIGCAEYSAFNAAERTTAISPHGYVAAEYEIEVDGRKLGDATVWSDGAWENELDGRERTVLHVGIDIDNETRAWLVLDPSQLYVDWAVVDSQTVRDVEPYRIDGAVRVAPRGSSRIEALFGLPVGIEPDDVTAFRVRWVLRDGTREYAQRTPFLQAPDLDSYYYSPFYDPFYDPFYGPGYGPGYRPYGPPHRLIMHDGAYRHYRLY